MASTIWQKVCSRLSKRRPWTFILPEKKSIGHAYLIVDTYVFTLYRIAFWEIVLILIRTLLTIFSGGGGSGGSEGGSGQEGTQGMISNLRISSKSSDFIAISWDIKGRYGTIITCFLLIVFLAFFFKEFRNWFDTSFLFIRFILFFCQSHDWNVFLFIKISLNFQLFWHRA